MPVVRAGLNLRVLGLWWNAELGSDVADIPIAVALIAINQGPFNHIEFSDGSRCLRKKLCSISPVGEAKNDSLGVMGLHVQKRTNLWTREPSLPDRLLWEISAM